MQVGLPTLEPNRFKIWDFKSILNVDLWLHSFKSSESYNDTKYSVQVFMKRCHCIKGDLGFQTEVEEGNSKLWRTPLKNGGGRESSWGRPDLGPQGDQGGEPRSMTTTSWFPLLRYGATRRSPCQLCLCQTDDWTAGNGFQTNILAHWSEPTLDLTPCMPDFISKLIIGIFGWKFIDFHVDLLLSSICPPKCLISYQNDKLE